MAPIRCSGGIVLDRDRRVWLAGDPGDEVHDARHHPGAPVAVGPPDATRTAVERARREVRRLVAAGGPLVAAAGVDLGNGFRSARLEGGGESRREAVLAAAELLGTAGLERLGEPAAVLVALFGPRATKRVGRAALRLLEAASTDPSGRAPLRLAVAASDLLGPEQLEEVLALPVPSGLDPVPRTDTALLVDQLASLLDSYSARRRLVLVRSLWEDVVAHQTSAAARDRARRRRLSQARVAAWRSEIGRLDDQWWREQADRELGPEPGPAAMLSWIPQAPIWLRALHRAFQEAVAATALLRTALAAEGQPVEDAVLAHLDQLVYAATADRDAGADRIAILRSPRTINQAAADRAAAVAGAVIRASDPAASDRPGTGTFLADQLTDVCELAHAVLASVQDLVRSMERVAVDVGWTEDIPGWRHVAGYRPERDPRNWAQRWIGPAERPVLAVRLDEATDPATAELMDDCLWVADLADALASWYGHERAAIGWAGSVEVDPPVAAPDPRVPSLESVPLAVAGAAQLVAIGAALPARPASWSALVVALLAGAERLGLTEKFPVAPEIADWDRRALPGTRLHIEVGRTPQQLAEWGNYMGNCIASYAEEAGEKFALVALRDPAGRLEANVSLVRGPRAWRVEEAYARFNGPVPAATEQLIGAWAAGLEVPAQAEAGRRAPVRRPAGPRRRHGGRPPTARDRVVRAAGRLGDALDGVDPSAHLDAVEPIARELGWSGGDGVSLFVAIARPRRPGPLSAATARAFETGCPLAELWQATAFRPLASAIAGAGATADGDPDLTRLTDLTVPPSLRVALRDPRVWNGRVVDLAGRRIRLALADLLATADPRLDAATVTRPHTGFLAAAVLALTASDADRPLAAVPVADDGSLPGRPRSSVSDPRWAQTARADAEEMGVAPDRIDTVLADAPGHHLLVPSTWIGTTGWPPLWARAHRTTREVVGAGR